MTKKRENSFYPAFDMLCGCSDALRKRILKEIPKMDLALALMGAGDAVHAYLLEPLTEKEREALEAQRPCFPRRVDAEAAQRNILEETERWKER